MKKEETQFLNGRRNYFFKNNSSKIANIVLMTFFSSSDFTYCYSMMHLTDEKELRMHKS